MVILVPNICLNKGGTYDRRLCAQTVKEIYALRSEIQYCLERKNQIKTWIKRLDTWRNSKLNSPKWSKIVQLIEQSSKLQKARENIIHNIELSGTLRYKDAMYILSDPSIQDEVSKLLEYSKVKGISINSLAASISKDGPMEIFPETEEAIKSRTPLSKFQTSKQSKENFNKYIKSQQKSSFWSFRNPFSPKIGEEDFRDVELNNNFGVKLGSFLKRSKSQPTVFARSDAKRRTVFARSDAKRRTDQWNVNDIRDDDINLADTYLDFARRETSDSRSSIDYIITNMSKISEEFKKNIEQREPELDEKITKFISKSKRTKVSVDELVRKFENDLTMFFMFKPSSALERRNLCKRILEYILSKNPDLQKYTEGDKVYWGLLEGNLVFEEKARKQIFKDTYQNALEKIFVESILNSFSKNGEQIKDLNRVYNNEQSHLAVQLRNVKQEARALEESIQEQQDMFKELQKRNIQELPDTVVRNLELWKRTLSPRTVASIMQYSNDLAKYLVLINELLHDDPNEYDLEMMSMIFNTRDEFDSKRYIAETNRRLSAYIQRLREYLEDWEMYQKNVESTLAYLFSSSADSVRLGLTNIKVILEQRPPAIFGMRKVQSETRKQTEKALALIRRADDAIRKTNDPELIAKLEDFKKQVRKDYAGVENLSDEQNPEVSYEKGRFAGQKFWRKENPYEESSESIGKGQPVYGGQFLLNNRSRSPKNPPTAPPPPNTRNKVTSELGKIIKNLPKAPTHTPILNKNRNKPVQSIRLPPGTDINELLDRVVRAQGPMVQDKVEYVKQLIPLVEKLLEEIPADKASELQPLIPLVEKLLEEIPADKAAELHPFYPILNKLGIPPPRPLRPGTSQVPQTPPRRRSTPTMQEQPPTPPESPRSDGTNEYPTNWDQNDKPEQTIGNTPINPMPYLPSAPQDIGLSRPTTPGTVTPENLGSPVSSRPNTPRNPISRILQSLTKNEFSKSRRSRKLVKNMRNKHKRNVSKRPIRDRKRRSKKKVRKPRRSLRKSKKN